MGTDGTDYTVMPMPNRLKVGTDPETTIRRMLWQYPGLFQSRTDAVYHLLYVPGGGYEWDGGELVSVFDYEPEDKPSTEVYKDPERYPGTYADLRADRDAEYASVRSDLERAAKTWGAPHRALRDETRGCRIENVPADVTPAWADLVRDALTVMPPFFAEQARTDARDRLAGIERERTELLERIAKLDAEAAALSISTPIAGTDTSHSED